MAARHAYFATAAPGLEPALLAEAQALRLPRAELRGGGVSFEGSEREEWRANLHLRTAIRVLRRLARFRATTADELYDAVGDLPWEDYLSPEGTLVVDGRANRSTLDHTQFLEQRVKDAVVDRFRRRAGVRPSVDKVAPDLRINVHVFRDRATVSLDTSGDSLHRRGWRVHQGRAPLAETTAAALLILSGWDRRAPVLDPFCGTGTILVEAAWMAAGLAPGLRRRFAFEDWPGHDARRFAAAKERAREEARPTPRLRLVGRDLDPRRIEEARENAEAAGVGDRLELEVGDVRRLAPRRGWNAWVVTNPPYGRRVDADGADLGALHADFGALLRERCAGYRLALLSGDPRLVDRLGFPGAERRRVVHGGLECELVQVDGIEPPA